MTNTYLMDIIRALHPDELQEFSEFLSYSAFNKGPYSKHLGRLYALIVSAAPEFSGDKLERNNVYTGIFPEKKVVDGKLDKLMTELNKVLRQFIMMKRYGQEDDDIDAQLNWVTWLRERSVDNRFQQFLPKLKEDKALTSWQSLKHCRQLLRISEEEHEWKSNNNRVKGDLGIPELVKALDLYYINYRTELLNRLLLQKKAVNLSSDDQILNPVFSDSLLDGFMDESPLLLITHSIQVLLQSEQPSEEAFYEVIRALQREGHRFPKQTLIQFFTYLRSYCIILVDRGLINFVYILHELHKENLRNGVLLLENGKIGPNSYLNIVLIALRTKDIAWAFEFVEEYKGLIHTDDPDNVFYQLGLANCYFENGELDKALSVLPETPSSSFYHLFVRRLELKIYYEQQSDLLTYKMDAFRKFIERTATKMISPEIRAINIEFVNVLLQLSQSPMKDAKRSVQLIKRIEEKKVVGERIWLLEKAKALA